MNEHKPEAIVTIIAIAISLACRDGCFLVGLIDCLFLVLGVRAGTVESEDITVGMAFCFGPFTLMVGIWVTTVSGIPLGTVPWRGTWGSL